MSWSTVSNAADLSKRERREVSRACSKKQSGKHIREDRLSSVEEHRPTVCLGHGRRLGDGPPKISDGGRPMHPSPNILRTSVIGCEAKYTNCRKKVFRRNFGL